jgi:ornithine cyclodeaminase/alanine dehydrogenase-like protein (mu-crystallin family)/threonine dehydratase
MSYSGTLLLSRAETAELMEFEDYLAAVEDAFRLHAEGKVIETGLLHADAREGEYHIKSGGLYLERPFFAVKANGGFFRNPERGALPAIQGIIYLSDAATGYPLAILDSVEITRQRTAAATALAAKHLARSDSSVITVCGAGAQARQHLRTFARVFALSRVFVFSRNTATAGRFASEMAIEIGLPIEAATDLSAAARQSDIILTCTTSRRAFLESTMVPPGAFVGAVGADSPQKQELAPELLAGGKVVVDLREQCAQVGELHHAIDAGLMRADQIHAELGEIVTAKKPGRSHRDEVFIFDSTGTALQDVAAAARVYGKAIRAGKGTVFDFAAPAVQFAPTLTVRMRPLQEAIRPTTIIEAPRLSKHLGANIVIASETFQLTGSFKFRAAYNVAINVPHPHIIAASSGNFGQALAYACQLTGKQCTIVMPHNSAAVKVEAVRDYGATVDLINTREISRSARVHQLASESGEAYIASAYDDPLVIGGNSSLGDELLALGRQFDAILVPVGGGGLIGGVLQSFARANNSTKIFGAEPALANDAVRSLQRGELVTNEQEPQTIADGARTVSLGHHNWAIIRERVAGILEVSEDEIREGVRVLYNLANLKVEPTGSLAIGALLGHPEQFRGQAICCVVSGGNVDPAVYRDCLI